MTPKADDDAGQQSEARNTVVAGVAVWVMLGFVPAAWLGTIPTVEAATYTDWIQSITAVAASVISAVAVVLVGNTLKAPCDSLDSTLIMAEDQRKLGENHRQIGKNQVRVWVVVNRVSASDASPIFCDARIISRHISNADIDLKNHDPPWQKNPTFAILSKRNMLIRLKLKSAPNIGFQ